MFPSPIINKYGNTVITYSIKKIVYNISTVMILYDNGELYGFGANGNGVLGTGNSTNTPNITLLKTGVQNVWLGNTDSLIKMMDGTYMRAG